MVVVCCDWLISIRLLLVNLLALLFQTRGKPAFQIVFNRKKINALNSNCFTQKPFDGIYNFLSSVQVNLLSLTDLDARSSAIRKRDICYAYIKWWHNIFQGIRKIVEL